MIELVSKIELSAEDFNWFRELIAREAGFDIKKNKLQFVYNRVMRRMQILGVKSFSDYKEYLQGKRGVDELDRFLEEIVNHETSFFRYKPHFEFFRNTILNELVKSRAMKGLRVNILSAGCATGEELYSLAIIIYESVLPDIRLLFKLKGIDISAAIIDRARRAIYLEHEIEELPSEYVDRYFIKDANVYRLIPQIKELASFYPFNMLYDKWHHFHYSDVIFCRNTLIYFTKDAKDRVLHSLTDALRDGGYLVLGHTEIIDGDEYGLDRVTSTIYRKGRRR